MVLTNSGSLFSNEGLLQDDGVLNERWQQDGSTLINLTDSNVQTDRTMYTVTAGKTVYIKQIIVQTNIGAGAGRKLIIKDNATTKHTINTTYSVAGDSFIYDFVVPLSFSTSIYLDTVVSVEAIVTMSGWEE